MLRHPREYEFHVYAGNMLLVWGMKRGLYESLLQLSLCIFLSAINIYSQN
jgi:hypothetical protein